MAHRSLFQALFMVRRWLTKAPPDNHAVAIAGHAVANGTKDLKPFLTPIQNLLGDRKRKLIDIVRIGGSDLCSAGV